MEGASKRVAWPASVLGAERREARGRCAAGPGPPGTGTGGFRVLGPTGGRWRGTAAAGGVAGLSPFELLADPPIVDVGEHARQAEARDGPGDEPALQRRRR